MGLFFKKKTDIDSLVIYSPFNGRVMPIEKLKDQTFANKVMGDGIAIIPTDGKIYAPVSGTVGALLDTKHAYGITSDAGYELLVHVGQNTVNLKGEHFTTQVKEGDHINKGDLLGTFDIPAITGKGYDIATPIILIAGGDYKIVNKTQASEVKVGDPLITISK